MDNESGRPKIFRARWVVTMAGPPIENGAVATQGGRIVEAGPAEPILAAHAGEVLDLGERVLLPGLVNAHCHLDYTCLRGRIPPPEHSFTDWIRGINAEKANLTPDDYVQSIKQGLVEAKRYGTAALANLTAFPELIARVQPTVALTWFAELIDVRSSESPEALVERALGELRAGEQGGLAPHAPFTASKELYRSCERRAAGTGTRVTTHLAESRDEMAMFRDGAGPLYEFMKGIGRDMSDCGRATPLARFLSIIDSARPWLIAHLNELTESDWALLAEVRPNFSIVHCPRSHRYFRHTPFPFERLRSLGFEISLGTDSLASNDDLSLFAEMREFQRNFLDVCPEEIVRMCTRNPAQALGRSDRFGQLAVGASDSLIAIPFSEAGADIYGAIVAFDGIPWVNGPL